MDILLDNNNYMISYKTYPDFRDVKILYILYICHTYIYANGSQMYNSIPDPSIKLSQISAWMVLMYLRFKCVYVGFPLLL